MIRGLYSAASGMLAQQSIQETLASNIANASVVAYKQDIQTFRALQGMALRRLDNGMGKGVAIGELGAGVAPDAAVTDWQNGPVTLSGNPLDISLAPGQFVAVRAPRGERYTRAGNFRLDGAGNVLTAGGLPVLGADGQPLATGGAPGEPKFDPAGNLVVNGQPVGRLRIVQIDPRVLARDGDSLLASRLPGQAQPVANPTITPGALEQSNVNVVRGLVDLITVSRAFEMAQKALTTQDELLRHAANDLGK